MFASVTGFSTSADLTFAIPVGVFAMSVLYGFFVRKRMTSRR
ncbi:MAG: hypothetical protein ACYDHP_01665 [Ferrimicrobium sp.]